MGSAGSHGKAIMVTGGTLPHARVTTRMCGIQRFGASGVNSQKINVKSFWKGLKCAIGSKCSSHVEGGRFSMVKF